jgi:threonine dehydrogenase-like Zn-dependent dehydrogenase
MFVERTPVTMGHEFSGVVWEVGEGVSGFSPGDAVVGDPRISCEACPWCARGLENVCPRLAFIGEARDGCFAEYVLMEARKLVKLPPDADLRRAALAEPAAVALRVVSRARIARGDVVGIVGAGPIGLLTLLILKRAHGGCVWVVDKVRARLELAKVLGADFAVESVPDEAEHKVDVAIEAAGSEGAFRAALRWLRPRGTLVMAGLYEGRVQWDANLAVTGEVTIVGTSAYQRSELEEAAELVLQDHGVGLVVTDVVPLSSAVQVLSELSSGHRTVGKVLLAA